MHSGGGSGSHFGPDVNDFITILQSARDLLKTEFYLYDMKVSFWQIAMNFVILTIILIVVWYYFWNGKD